MKKIDAPDSRAWADSEKRSHKEVCLALQTYKPFVDRIVDRVGYSRDNRNPVVQLLCPRGHSVLKVQVHCDIPKTITLGHWELDLHEAGREEDNYVPASQVLVEDTEIEWGTVESRWAWTCAFHAEIEDPTQTGNCRTEIEWGTIFCDDHKDAAEPDGLNMLWENRVRVRCPQCPYSGTHRRTSLLVEYAIAVATRRQKMRLRS